MHLSRPSACRWSTGRPWSRGAVGRFSSGYSSVTTFLNIVLKVTPKPATGATRSFSPLGRSALGRSGSSLPRSGRAVLSGPLTRHLLHWRWVVVHGGRSGQHGNRMAATSGRRHGLLCLLHLLVLDDERADQEDEGDGDADVRNALDAAVPRVAQLAERRHDHQPDQAEGNQDLPPELHELVVAQPRQRAAQPDVEE